jgi:hypothetical protein
VTFAPRSPDGLQSRFTAWLGSGRNTLGPHPSLPVWMLLGYPTLIVR